MSVLCCFLLIVYVIYVWFITFRLWVKDKLIEKKTTGEWYVPEESA